MARTGRESRKADEERNSRLVGAAETSKELVEWRKLQRKNFNKLGLPKRERVVSVLQAVNCWQGRQNLAKEKRNRLICPDREVGECVVEKDGD